MKYNKNRKRRRKDRLFQLIAYSGVLFSVGAVVLTGYLGVSYLAVTHRSTGKTSELSANAVNPEASTAEVSYVIPAATIKLEEELQTEGTIAWTQPVTTTASITTPSSAAEISPQTTAEEAAETSLVPEREEDSIPMELPGQEIEEPAEEEFTVEAVTEDTGRTTETIQEITSIPETSRNEESTEKETLEEASEAVATETSPVVTMEESSEAVTIEETVTESVTEVPETTTLSELEIAEREDRKLREKALEKFANLGIVSGVNNYLNMRSAPSENGEICGVIFAGCGVDVLEDQGDGWLKIRSGDATGYVASSYIVTGDQARQMALDNVEYQALVVSDFLNVYYEPSEASGVITTIVRGDLFPIVGYGGDSWIKVEAVEGLSGYVHAEGVSAAYYLEEGIVFGFDSSVSQLRKDIINTAFQYYGGRYVWGGESLTDGVDCSAYVLNIFRLNGIDLHARVSYEQCNLGVEVSEADIKPGDLLFYVGRVNGQIGHVAIYIGNGKIIHAASEAKGICVSSWKFVPIVRIRDVLQDM